MKTDLTPNIKAFYEHGIVPEDQDTLTSSNKRKLRVLIDCYNHYADNPWMQVPKYLAARGISSKDITDMVGFFDFIRNNYSNINDRERNTRMVHFAGQKLIEKGAMNDDSHDLEAGAKILTKVHGLDKPEVSQEDVRNLSRLDIVFTPKPDMFGPDYKQIEDEELQKIFKRYEARTDVLEDKIRDKVAVLVSKSEAQNAEFQEIKPEEENE